MRAVVRGSFWTAVQLDGQPEVLAVARHNDRGEPATVECLYIVKSPRGRGGSMQATVQIVCDSVAEAETYVRDFGEDDAREILAASRKAYQGVDGHYVYDVADDD